MEVYEIKEDKNYRGETIYSLICDGIYIGSISQKNIDTFLLRNIAFNDSEGIKKYIKYNNL